MNIGYACLTKGIRNTDFRSCNLINAKSDKLIEIISHNLNSLENIIDYNIDNNIHLFRISSDIIPFGSNQVNTVDWDYIFSEKLHNIGIKIKNANIRVSMHPGQYTVLNSLDLNIVKKAISDLEYHNKFLDALNVDSKNKIILHIGGIYGNKNGEIKRFIDGYNSLSDNIKSRLVIENDERMYSIFDILEISKISGIPVVFDNLHNQLNPSDNSMSEIEWINECSKTWKTEDGAQKIHYSQQNLYKKLGSHSDTIKINEFMKFHSKLNTDNIDIMLEVKDKNLSAAKCINCVSDNKQISILEKEWSKYKYSVLEASPAHYQEIRNLLKDKNNFPALQFYTIIEDAFECEKSQGHIVNALQHVWGYFKNIADDKEKSRFYRLIADVMQDEISPLRAKSFLLKLAEKYNQEYLLNSYYFY